MRGVARSFWSLVTLVVAIEGIVVFLCIRSTRMDLSCWLPNFGNSISAYADCGRSIAFVGHRNWVPAATILIIFTVTLVAGVSTFLFQYVRTRAALRQLGKAIENPQRLITLEEHLHIKTLVKNDERCFCCTAGLMRPKVIISTEMLHMLDDPELEAVLAHEASHVRRRDPARAMAVDCASNALFYVPLIKYLARRTLVAVELGADAYAVDKAGRPSLINALLQVLNQARPALGTATEMASLESLDIRIEALRTRGIPSGRPRIVDQALSAGALCGLILLGLWLPAPVNSIVVSHLHSVPH